MNRMLSTGLSSTLVCLPLILAAWPAGAQGDPTVTDCNHALGLSTSCISNGHSTYSPTLYPYTEDITSATSSPIADGLVLSGPSTGWTTIQAGCQSSPVNGMNLNGTAPFNSLLRVQVLVLAATAPVGAGYEVQLVVDGVPYGRYLRRLRGVYPQADVFASSVQGLPAGNHSFTVQAHLLDSGTITLSNTYMTAQGAPTTLPSARDVNPSQLTLVSTAFRPVTDTVTFTNSQAVDLAIQGYLEIDAGASGQEVLVRPFLDGVRQDPRTSFGIPPSLPSLPDGVNILTMLTSIAPGTHTLSLNAVTGGFTTTFSTRVIEFVAFPASTFKILVMDNSGTPKTVSSSTTEQQPLFLKSNCGLWTKLLEGTIPPGDEGALNQTYEGFIRFLPGATGAQRGRLSFESLLFPPGSSTPDAATDGGGRVIEVPAYPDGAYLFGDTMIWSNGADTEDVSLWAKLNCAGAGGGAGQFSVSDRFLFVKHVPIVGGCYYN